MVNATKIHTNFKVVNSVMNSIAVIDVDVELISTRASAQDP
jgi:hypothetical protein